MKFLVLLLIFLPSIAFAQDASVLDIGPWWVSLVIAVVGAAIAILREFAPKTPSNIDDKLLALMSSELNEDKIRHLSRILNPTSEIVVGPSPNNATGRQ